jgi:hypothetical protein
MKDLGAGNLILTCHTPLKLEIRANNIKRSVSQKTHCFSQSFNAVKGNNSCLFRKSAQWRMFENRVLRLYGPKRDEVTGGWRKLHNEALHNLYSSPSIIRMIKSRSVRWAGHVA